jgi:DnaJ-class molecular chaperone
MELELMSKRDNMVYNSVKIMCELDAFILMSQQKSMECVTGIHSQKKQWNKQRGEVVVHSMKVSLEDLYNGTSKRSYCSLNTKKKGSKSGVSMKCSRCQGSGIKVSIRHLGLSLIQQIQHVCRVCRGTILP